MIPRNRSIGLCRHAATTLSTLLISFTICATALAADITIGIIGDQTGTEDIAASYGLLQSGVDAINAQNPDVVLHVGDLVESKTPSERISSLFKQATGILAGLKSQWYLTPGDHDVNPIDWIQDSPDHSNEKLFKSLYAAINPLVKDNFYYSFNVKGYHFISLYALEHLNTDPRWGNVFLSGISDSQYRWLQKDLSSMNPSAKGVIVFVHQPLWYNWGDWERVHNLLRDYPMVAVIAGHFHYGQAEQHEFPYITVGATGGDIKDTTAATGGLQHVTVATVTGRTAKINVIPLTTTQRIDLPHRSEMDRIQAVDSELPRGQVGKVFLKSGQLVGCCTTKSPAVIELSGIGNPTNFPGTLTLSVMSPGITVEDPSYDKTICNKVSPDVMTCGMDANAGIYYSNTSIVGSDTSKAYTWKGTLKAIKRLDSATPINLYAKFSFGTAGTLDYVGKSFQISVDACPDSLTK